ncbi:hypothetical protein BH10ACT3_BH10ACT3_12520 [soil metagenome]
MKTRSWLAGAVALLAVMGVAASCAPTAPDGSIATKNWTFKANSVKVNSSQDAVYDPIFGACISFAGCKDEPYLLNIGFRVKIGVPGSASAFVVNPRTDAPEDVAPGTTVNVSGAAASATTFNGVQALDLADLANTNNHLEVVGTYVWASEEDTIGNGAAGSAIAGLLTDALNDTLASTSLTNLDASFIINLILNNIGGAFGIIANNLPTLGLGDDVLGGGMYIGIGAQGTLGSALDAVIGTTPFPTIAIPVVSVPPDITGGGIYTLTGGKTFAQTFVGAGGSHTWNMSSGPA